jgi:dimethylargininase
MLIALTRAVSPNLAQCELTHLDREPIDVARAIAQHDAYEAALVSLGCSVQRVPADASLADAVFIEDTAVVVDEVAVVTRPGAESRRGELADVASVLSRYRPLRQIEAPGTLDGGDVLRIGSSLFAGLSQRTNEEGVRQLRQHLQPFGYSVTGLPLTGCLHLKTAITQIGESSVLLNPEWVIRSAFAAFEQIEVDPAEPFAANALRVEGVVVYAAAHVRTRERLDRRGVRVVTVEADELAKAEGGVTCCSVLVGVS